MEKLDIDVNDIFGRLRDRIALESEIDAENYLPNIIEFCESNRYLNLPDSGIRLFPMQRIILKIFYRGQKGNEHLKLTEDELKLLVEYKMDKVIAKYRSEHLFRELVLVLGRRCISGDTLVFDAKTGENKSVEDWHKDGGNLSIWTYNEKSKQFEINKAETIEQGSRECFRVVVDNGDYVDCTDNHPLLAPDGWKQLKDLKVGDLIAQADDIPKTNNGEDLHFSKIKSIDSVGNKQTFDICIYNSNSSSHNFVISNGLQMHNSGKDFLTSIIALYEAMKLLECPTGSPFTYYGLASGNPIYILTIATSGDQAHILFNEMKARIHTSEYFRSKVGKIEIDKMWLLTPEDRKHNKKLVESGQENIQTPGSVVIMSGHSNSESLLGKRIFALLLDEVASFKSATASSSSGDRIYSALTPATSDFKIPGKTYVNEQGKELPFYDSKIISISSPRAEEGILYKLYREAPDSPSRLAFKLPTWKVNLQFDEDSLRSEFKFINDTEFAMEFGAEFSGTAGEKFIPNKYVDEAMDLGRKMLLTQKMHGYPGQVYFAHLDPATRSHNYALVILHIEERMRVTERNGLQVKEKIKLFVVDHLKFWQPTVDESIKIDDVDQYIIRLARLFRFAMVSFDDFNSTASMQKIRAKGIPTRITSFRKQYKIKIYDALEQLLVNHQLVLPYKGDCANQLIGELKCLKRIYTPNGFKIKPDPESNFPTDDMVDALAGAIGSSSESIYTGYPKSSTVNMPQFRDDLSHKWNIGRGSYPNNTWSNISRKFGKLNPYGG